MSRPKASIPTAELHLRPPVYVVEALRQHLLLTNQNKFGAVSDFAATAILEKIQRDTKKLKGAHDAKP